MAGIYIHIPFCKQACHYCNFHFSTSSKGHDAMVAAILSELELRRHFFTDQSQIDSIYFGGGTPSLLSQNSISEIINLISKFYSISPKAEITLEANPDDLKIEKINELIRSGVNRLSIGLQSFHDSELKLMNRVHSAVEAYRCVKDAQDAGLTNLSIDLIFGMPGSTLDSWKYNLSMATELNVPHMSCYALTVEPRTALAHMINANKIANVNDQLSADQFILTINELEEMGYEHYEISSYARDGQYAVHNTNYWRFVPYLGLGPSAHSYDGMKRSWNMANNALYINSINQETLPIEDELLSAEDRLNEYLMTGLRTMWGCEWKKIDLIVPNQSSRIQKEIQMFIKKGFVHLTDQGFRLSQEGKLYADQISGDLFL